jgi:hypothetical protein
MLRWKSIGFITLFLLLVPLTAYPDKVENIYGVFKIVHIPVNPQEPDGFSDDPPGLLFNVTSESFDGELVIKRNQTQFTGTAVATGCALLVPVDGVAAHFTGSFTWQTANGALRGTFELLDYPTEFEGVFAAVIFIKFDGGSGRFKKTSGTAIAEGFDFPFGGLSGDPFAAGVVANIVEGQLNLIP